MTQRKLDYGEEVMFWYGSTLRTGCVIGEYVEKDNGSCLVWCLLHCRDTGETLKIPPRKILPDHVYGVMGEIT